MLSSATSVVIGRWPAIIRRWRCWLGRRWAMTLSAWQSPADSHDGTAAAAAHASSAISISGEPEFDAFFAQFEQPLFGYVRRIVVSEEVAIDIVQETFVRAWQHFAAVRGYERPQAWLYRVATHLALNQRRDQHTIAFTEMQPTDATGARLEDRWADPLDLEEQTVTRDTINQILQALPARQRAALLLRAVYGLSFVEVAEALGMTPVAARKTLSRAREQFRARFAAQAKE